MQNFEWWDKKLQLEYTVNLASYYKQMYNKTCIMKTKSICMINGNFEQPQLTVCQKSWRVLFEETEKELDFILSIQNVNSS